MTGKKHPPPPGTGDWVVSTERPEEQCSSPREYWTRDRILAVARASGQARIQYKLAMNAWMHLSSRIQRGSTNDDATTILDVGCGLGFVGDLLACDGRVVVGIDMIPDMIEIGGTRAGVQAATRRGSYHPAVASAQHLPFRSGVIDVAISVSAMQWAREAGDIEGLGRELNRVVVAGGGVAIQFFPRSRDAMMNFGQLLGAAGFDGGIVIDNPDNPRKRRVYLVAGKREGK